ncbi:RidA family protein [Burkholderia sp. A1]|uniref:RidA family protein n=1 Tax=Burkholderia sp. A1 TaxID=148446 RepID=UPI0005BBAFD6|nr:RidA family protein [Burkholderia sp. A1]
MSASSNLLTRLHATPEAARIPGVPDGVIVEKGRQVYLSGHVPIDDAGQILPPDFRAQVIQVFENLKRTMQHAGIEAHHLIRIAIYVCDLKPEHLPVIRDARSLIIDPANPPASTLIGVEALFNPDVRFEVDLIAVIPDAQ